MISDCSGLKKNQIRGQCTPRGTQVVICIVAVPISNMAPSSKDDVGVQYDAAIQQNQTIVEKNDVYNASSEVSLAAHS